MKLCLLVQYNYNGSVSIAEPTPTMFYDYTEVCVAGDVESAKQKAKEIYYDYDITFIDDTGELV